VHACSPIRIRRWRNIAPDIEQPPLDHHFVSLHLGGSKRIRRTGEGGALCQDVHAGAFSVVPAGSSFLWRTYGPVDFAHIYIDPGSIAHAVSTGFDRDPRDVALEETLGGDDPLLRAVLGAMLDEAAAPEASDRVYAEDLLQLFLHQLLRRHSTVRITSSRARHALAPHHLRRALEFIESSLAADIGLAEIAAVTGMSAFHFSRAFRRDMGVSPYAFLIQRRVAGARTLLIQTELPLTCIADRCGFGSHSQFSRTFKRSVGLSPGRYRAQH